MKVQSLQCLFVGEVTHASWARMEFSSCRLIALNIWQTYSPFGIQRRWDVKHNIPPSLCRKEVLCFPEAFRCLVGDGEVVVVVVVVETWRLGPLEKGFPSKR